MGNCIINGITIDGDINESIAKAIKKAANGDSVKEMVFASYVFDQEFQNYVRSQVKEFDSTVDQVQAIAKIKINPLTKLFKEYYDQKVKSIDNNVAQRRGESLNGFGSAVAKQLAVNYTADRLFIEYNDNLLKPRSERKKNRELLDDVYKYVRDHFEDNIGIPLHNLLRKGKQDKKIKPLVDRIQELREKANSLSDRMAEIDSQIDEIYNGSEWNQEIKNQADELENKYDEVQNEYNEARNLLDIELLNLADTAGTVQQKNYANLYKQLRINNASWFHTVLSTGKLSFIAKQFESQLENASDTNYECFDENELPKLFEDYIDLSTKAWEDSWNRDFAQYASPDMRMYFESIYHLTSYQEVGQEANYDTNNELGVPRRMGARYIMSQIYTYCQTDSVDNLIKTMETLARTHKENYGMSKIVNEMKSNPIFANKMFNIFSHPIYGKGIIELGNNNTANLTVSNRSESYKNVLATTMNESLESTVLQSYNEDDHSKLKPGSTLRSRVLKYQKNREEAVDLILKTMYNFFPALNIEVFGEHLKQYITDNENGGKILLQYIDKLAAIYNAGEKYINARNAEVERYNNARKVWNNNGKIGKKPVFEYGNMEGASTMMYDACNYFAYELDKLKIIPVKVDFNTFNAQNNRSSDIGPNNYISNLDRQIQFSSEEDADAGLNAIKERLKVTHQYDYSPFYFGAKNSKGETVFEGLFIKNPDGTIQVNPNAKNLFKFHLFNGTRFSDYSNSTLYYLMSKGDYFLTSLIANKAYGFNRDGRSKDMCGVFLETPSDAKNNYIAFVQNLNKNEKTFNRDAENDYVNSVLAEIESSILENTKKPLEYYSRIWRENAQQVINNEKSAISAEDFIDLSLRNVTEFNYNTMPHVDNGDGTVTIPVAIYKTSKYGNRTFVAMGFIKGKKSGSYQNTILNPTIEMAIYKERIIDPATQKITVTETQKMGFDAPLKDALTDHILSYGYERGIINNSVNRESATFRVLYNILYGELNNYINSLNSIIKVNKKGELLIDLESEDLFDNYHKKGTIIGEDGKLTGNAFKFTRLFLTDTFDANSFLEQALSLYGGKNALFVKSGKTLKLNKNRTDLIQTSTSQVELGEQYVRLCAGEEIKALLESAIDQWLQSYKNESHNYIEQYRKLLDENQERFLPNPEEVLLQNAVTYMMFDDVLYGDSKYSKDARRSFKRAKKVTTGGDNYANQDLFDSCTELKDLENKAPITINGVPLKVPRYINGEIKITDALPRNGWRAITIANTKRSSLVAQNIYEDMLKSNLALGMSEEQAIRIAEKIARPFGYSSTGEDGEKTVANDGISYITFEEWINRMYALGKLNEYEDLIQQIMDIRSGKKTIKDIDLAGIAGRIQMQKNVYYDMAYSKKHKQYYPRFIKNAEFVIVPELLPEGSSLIDLYNIMVKNDIGQVNTIEASKEANQRIYTFWDNNGIVNPNFEQELQAGVPENGVETCFYKYLYRQQEVQNHMQDEENKFGTQVSKKIVDNANMEIPEIKEAVNKYFNSFVSNIREDYQNLINRLGWTVRNGKITNKDGNILSMKEFYRELRLQAIRLGMDANFMDYLTPDEFGVPIMPNFMNGKSQSLMNIAQALFNKSIIRQRMPGWHAAQIPDVGMSEKLKYHPAVIDENGNITHDAYMEIMIPRWSNLIPKGYSLEKLQKEGLDMQLIYRIPTEGKQSVTVAKIVGFLDDAYGSTVVVPEEWVTQTSSDFDIDTIYAMCYEMNKDKDGVIRKVLFDEDMSESGIRRRYIQYVKNGLKERMPRLYDDVRLDEDERVKLYNEISKLPVGEGGVMEDSYFAQLEKAAIESGLATLEDFSSFSIEDQNTREARNNRILDSLISIMSHPSSREENYGRSNYDEFMDAIELMDSLRGETTRKRSQYNPMDQMDFMEDGIIGSRLKAISVNLDTFFSITNKGRAELGTDPIEILYDLNAVDKNGNPKYRLQDIIDAYGEDVFELGNGKVLVRHRNLAWSNNNRNVSGMLITPYVSQTTAHILDAVKAGSMYNENLYNFSTFKTLLATGVDYETAVAFLTQPGLVEVTKQYNELNSIYVYSNSGKNRNNKLAPIKNAIKKIASDLGLTVYATNEKGEVVNKRITRYTSLNDVINSISTNKEIQNCFEQLFGRELKKDFNKKMIPLEAGLMEDRIANRGVFAETNKGYELMRAAFDLAMIGTFNQIRGIAGHVDSLQRISNPHSSGVEQTIDETRELLENIEKYSDPISGAVIQSNGLPFAKALYPLNEDGSIDVENSIYPSMAAMVEYAIKPSIEINSKLFDTESDYFNEVVKEAQRKLGIVFDKEMKKAFRQYAITTLYNHIPILSSPLIVNEYGYVGINEEQLAEQAANNVNYWNTERARIAGYDASTEGWMKVNDIHHPTKEELQRFARLTPAQKILWMQKNFIDNAGIFSLLKVNVAGLYSGRRKGYSNSWIRINDSVDDLNTLIEEFGKAYWHKNPLVKMAAIDLIKYAYLVEGFKFKKYDINRIIPNDCMYTSISDFGMGIVQSLRTQFYNNFNINSQGHQEAVEKFIRSHSDIIEPIRIRKSKENGRWEDHPLENAGQITGEGLIFIPFTDAGYMAISSLELKGVQRYIRLNRKTGEEKNTSETILYKVVVGDKGIYLMPLNLLNENETSDYSVNSNNNKFKSADYFEKVIEIFETATVGLAEDERYKALNKNKSEYEIAKTSDKIKEIDFTDPDILFNLSRSATPIARREIDKFLKDIDSRMLKNENGNPMEINENTDISGTTTLVWNENYLLKEIFPKGGQVYQNVFINGIKTKVAINQVSVGKNFMDAIRGKLDENDPKYKRLPADQKALAIELKNSKIVKPTLYKITIVKDEDARYASTDFIEDNEFDKRFAVSSPVEEGVDLGIGEESYADDDIDAIGRFIIHDINHQYMREDNNIYARRFRSEMASRGIDINSLKSIGENRKSVYTSAATYCMNRAAELRKKLNGFAFSTGEIFKMSDPALYQYLSTHPDSVNTVLKTILDCLSFGEEFYGIFNLDISGEDAATQLAIQQIRNAINEIRNSEIANKAKELMFEEYFANEFSTNPMVRMGLVKLRTQFWDSDWFDLNFAGVGELNNKQVSTMVKYAEGLMGKAHYDSIEAAEEWQKEYDRIYAMAGSFNWNNIVNKDFQLIKPYIDKFIEDREKYEQAINQAIENFGKESIEYHKAVLARDEWREKNVEQMAVQDYYRKTNANFRKVLTEAGDLFTKYTELIHKLNEDRRPIKDLNKAEKLARKALRDQIRNISSEYAEDGKLKSEDQIRKIKALNNYKLEKQKIDSEYFDRKESDGWAEMLNRNLEIMKKYETKHPTETLTERLEDDAYADAYDWVFTNSIYRLNEESKKKLDAAMDLLRKTDRRYSREIDVILEKATDEYGNVDPRKLSIEDIARIKEIIQSEESAEYERTGGESILIKNVPKRKEYTDEYYKDVLGVTKAYTAERKKVIARINELIRKAGGTITTDSLFLSGKLTNEELRELGNLYAELREIKYAERGKRDKNDKVKYKVNDPAFRKEYEQILKLKKEGLVTDEQVALWTDIFCAKTLDGKHILRKVEGKLTVVGNNDIYGYTEADEKYIDEARTKAKEFINKSVRYTTSEYYEAAKRKAEEMGKEAYDKWYAANHVYNPYTHEYEPLRIWMKREIVPNDEISGEYEYIPTFDNMIKSLKTEKENKNFKKGTINYNSSTGGYTNAALSRLSEKEKTMMNFLQDTLNNYAMTNPAKKFVNQGYLPRRAKYTPDTKWYAEQALGAVGLTFDNTGESSWTDHLSYANDRDSDQNMMGFIKAKGYQELLEIPEKELLEDEATYAKRVAEIEEENRKREEKNKEIDRKLADRDIRSVFQDFVRQAVIYNARQKAKNAMYLTLEDLKTNKAYVNNRWNGKLKKRLNTKEGPIYERTEQENTFKVVENYLHRLIFNEYKLGGKAVKYGNLMQNITSAKYMIFNVTGGFANIFTGLANIAGETFANDYFGKDDFRKGQGQYFKNSLSFLADLYSPTTKNLTVGIAKLFDIVDFDAFTERRPNESATEYVKRFRNSLYSFQTGGEHYMQNAVLFAMLKSHRIWKDEKGKTRVGSLSDYMQDRNMNLMKKLVASNSTYALQYKVFIDGIKKDLNQLKKYDMFSRDINEDFIRLIKDKKLTDAYLAARKESKEQGKKEFNKLETVESQFELVDGLAKIKTGSQITSEHFGELRDKVIKVNHKIHGIYDRVNAARIEREWWGGLVMQYHKHIYPGLMKRFRIHGYYNETRGTVERGSYVALASLLTREFRHIPKNSEKDSEHNAIRSIRSVVKATIDSIINLRANYRLMPDWEQDNVRRCFGDLLGVGAAFLMAIALHALTDDDDEIKDSEMLSTLLYLADRCNTESAMWTPWGMIGEARTLWSSPIAMTNGPEDLLKALNIGAHILLDGEYDPVYSTGLYKGENKLWVLLRRNIPAYRVYDRLSRMTKNNKYYRINDNTFSIKLAKNIADAITED